MRQTGKIQMKLIDTEAHKDEVKEALGTDSFRLLMRAFFFPKMVRSFFIRFLIVAAVAWLFFKFICLPLIVAGGSMLPTYAERGFNFCWRPAYWFSEPERGDVVVMKYQMIGTDPVALDTAAARLIKFNLNRIGHIRIGESLGIGTTRLNTLNIRRITV